MKTIFLIGSGVIIAGAIGFAWSVSRAVHQAEAAIANLDRKEATTSTEVQRAEARIRTAETEQARFRSRLEKLRQSTDPGSVGPSSQPTTPAPAPMLAQKVEIASAQSREEMKAAFRQVESLAKDRVRFGNAYRPLFALLNLSPAQIEEFMAIGLRRFETQRDLYKQTVVHPNDPIFEKLKEAAEAEEDAAYRKLLGEPAYQRLHDYDRTNIAREKLGSFAADAVFAGVPFTVAQLDAMIPIVANYTLNYRMPMPTGVNPPAANSVPTLATDGRNSSSGHYALFKSGAIDWDAVSPQLRPLMSDAQWTLYQSQPRERLSDKFETAIRRAVETDVASAAAQSTKPPTR